MTEDIGSDKHRRPSNAEIDARIMRFLEKWDEKFTSQGDIIIEKLSKIQVEMARGEEKFRRLEKFEEDTTTTLEKINADVNDLKTDTRARNGIIASCSAIIVAIGAVLVAFFNGGKP